LAAVNLGFDRTFDRLLHGDCGTQKQNRNDKVFGCAVLIEIKAPIPGFIQKKIKHTAPDGVSLLVSVSPLSTTSFPITFLALFQ
jgi:hypothetical protein